MMPYRLSSFDSCLARVALLVEEGSIPIGLRFLPLDPA